MQTGTDWGDHTTLYFLGSEKNGASMNLSLARPCTTTKPIWNGRVQSVPQYDAKFCQFGYKFGFKIGPYPCPLCSDI